MNKTTDYWYYLQLLVIMPLIVPVSSFLSCRSAARCILGTIDRLSHPFRRLVMWQCWWYWHHEYTYVL